MFTFDGPPNMYSAESSRRKSIFLYQGSHLLFLEDNEPQKKCSLHSGSLHPPCLLIQLRGPNVASNHPYWLFFDPGADGYCV
jgi:hypothetical protein